MADETTTSSERITCYIHAAKWMDDYGISDDKPAVLWVVCVYFLVNMATGRTVRCYRHTEFVPPKNDFAFSPGTWGYRGPFELAGSVRLAIGEQIKRYYETVYPDMVFVWYP